MIFVKLGQQFDQRHQKLRLFKDKLLGPLVNVLPDRLLPNHLTLFRLFIALIWLVIALIKPAWWQLAIFLSVYFFDLLDGALARYRNQITYFGKHLDVFSDGINHLVLLFVLLKLTNFQFTALKIFLVWEFLMLLYVLFEYFLRNEKITYFRIFWQFCVKTTLWSALLYEISRVYL